MQSIAKTTQTDKICLDDVDLTTKKHYRSGKHLFFSFFWNTPSLIAISLIFMLVSSLTRTYPAVLIGEAFDVLYEDGFENQFILTTVLIIIVSIVNFTSSFLANYVFGVTAFAYERDVRQEFFDVIQSHSLTFHDEQNSSKLLSMGMTEISQMRMGIMPSMRMIINAIFSIIITVFFLTQIQVYYGIIALLGFIIYFFFAYRYSRRIAPVRRNLANSIGELTEASQEIFRGIEVVRGMSADEREKNQFETKSKTYANLAEREGKMSAFYLPGLVLIAITVLMFGIGLVNVFNNEITAGQMIQAVALLLNLQTFNFVLPMALLNVQAGLVNSDRIWRIINWKDPQPDEACESTPVNWKGTITFDNVSFSYNGNNSKLALKNINVEIPTGSNIAVIGGPGSGKSTLLKLLLRLYDPQEGQILIDGIPLNQIPAVDVRQHVARVEQEIFLFSASIKENITFARPDASDKEIIAAAKAAQAHEFIDNMPERYDTVIGERGVTLSGGQRQRLAIARALLADPEILLLDDSVSAVDSKTEMVLRKALDNLMEGRTSLTVTQRLNTLVRADLIILLDKGETLAVGKHEELLETCPEYRQIFELLPESERITTVDKTTVETGGVS